MYGLRRYNINGDKMINYNYNGIDKSYTVTQLFVQRYFPIYKNLVRKRKVMNTVVYVLSGEICMDADKKYRVGAGQAAFVPIECEFVFTVLAPGTECIQVEFAVMDSNGQVQLTDDIMYLKNVPARLDSDFREILTVYSMRRKEDEFVLLSLLYSLINQYFSAYHNKNPLNNTISQAIEYLNSHYTEPTDVDTLAGMCSLSVSQFRRLFVSLFEISPIKYKNMLRLRDACNMLVLSDMNIGEIAHHLGFDDIYAFSHAFKKEYGCSPSNYRIKYKNDV